MRVLHLMAGADHGGAETACVDMCVLMASKGVDVRIATRPNEVRVPRLKDAGIPVHELPFGGRFDLRTKREIVAICKNFQPDILQTWMARAARKTPRWSPKMGIPQYKVVSRLGGYYKLKNFPATDFFTTITPDIARFLTDEGVAPDRILHINNFAEVEEPNTPVNRADFGTPDDVTVLLALGRLHTAKAYDIMMEAVRPLGDVYLWIAGEGPQRAELESLRKKLGLEKRVKFLGWRSDRAALLKACDICVFTSRYEPFGTVFVQAWAQGVPVIVSDADGPRQFVRHDEDGLVVPRDDVEALTAAIARLAGDRVLRAKIVESGRLRYRNEFTAEKCFAAYMELYRELTDHR
ncbi:MAG: glycosyltransferase [Alphaproteobacteria bacterium]|nr:glycosyltransferase [Alphaproteobacteria bacterium]